MVSLPVLVAIIVIVISVFANRLGTTGAYEYPDSLTHSTSLGTKGLRGGVEAAWNFHDPICGIHIYSATESVNAGISEN